MQISPSSILGLLQTSTKTADIACIWRAYSLLVSHGLDSLEPFRDALIRSFAACGCGPTADLVFTRVVNPSISTLHSITWANASAGRTCWALRLCHQIIKQGAVPDKFTLICMLKDCSSIGSLKEGAMIHEVIVNQPRLSSDVALQNALIHMYVKCGSLERGREVFDNLRHRNGISWGAMISGYSLQGQEFLALSLFAKMQSEGLCPNRVIFLGTLKACGGLRFLLEGLLIHDLILRDGLDLDDMIKNSLITMYGKCGGLQEARYVFGCLTDPDVFSYGALITGLAHYEQGSSAIEFFKKMQKDGINPNKFVFSSVVTACGSSGVLEQGQQIHDHIIRIGLESDVVIGSTLIDMYIRNRKLDDACMIFNKLPTRDMVSWAAMIGGYVMYGHGLLALESFEKMQQEGIKLDNVTILCVLKACGQLKLLIPGKEIHDLAVKSRLEHDVTVESALVDMYAKCGSLDDACVIFEKMQSPDAVSWSAVILGYADYCNDPQALNLVEKMYARGIKSNKAVFLCILKVCGKLGAMEEGRLVHEQIVRSGIELDLDVGNSLVDMYCKCGNMEAAKEVFDRLDVRDSVSWAVLIGGYAQNGCDFLVFEHSNKMQSEDIDPNDAIFCSLLKACGNLSTGVHGRLMHGGIIEGGFDSSIHVANNLIEMYAKCGSLEEAYRVFQTMPNPEKVSWGAILSGFVDQGHDVGALELFKRMHVDGFEPDITTLLSLSKAIRNVGTSKQVNLIYTDIVSSGYGSDLALGTSAVDMFASCGRLEDAFYVFENLCNRDVVSWGAMLAAFVHHEQSYTSLKLFEKMLQEGVDPNKPVFLCTLKACSSIGAIGPGEMMHHQIIEGAFDSDALVGNSLVDMYAKSGCMREALQLFSSLPDKDVVAWNALITGYSQKGNYELANQCVKDMQSCGLKPNDLTFTSILAACSHAGEVEEGRRHFDTMKRLHGIQPSIEHITCMIDLLGGAGYFDEAKRFLNTIPDKMGLPAWISLLAACRKWRNVDVGRECFDQIIDMDANIASAYVLMSNIYVDANMWEDASKVLELKRHASAWKEPGRALIEIGGNLHDFVVASKSLPQGEKVDNKLKVLSKSMRKDDYVPSLNLVLNTMANIDVQSGDRETCGSVSGLPVLSEGVTINCSSSFRESLEHIAPCTLFPNIAMETLVMNHTRHLHSFCAYTR